MGTTNKNQNSTATAVTEPVEVDASAELTHGYKMTKLGMIPNDWEAVKISDYTNGVDYRGKTPKKTNKGVFLVTAKNIKKGFIDYKCSVEYISKDSYEDVMFRGKPSLGEVLITTEAPMGNVAQIDRENIALAQRVIKLSSSSEKLSNNFLKWFLLSFNFQKELILESTGSTVKGIKGSRLKKMPLIIPPLKEQQQIANILTTWDKAITTTTNLLSNLRKRKKGLLQELLSGKKRLAGFSEEWSVSRLDETGKIYTGGTPSTKEADFWNGNINWFTPTEISKSGKFVEKSQRRITLEGIKKSSAVIFPKNTIIICTRATIGDLSIVKEKSSTNQGFKNIYVDENNDFEFFYYLLSSQKNNFIKKSSGSTFLELSTSNFKKFKVTIPPLAEQKAIANILIKADKEIESYQAYLQSLQTQKKGLMQQLLTGKKRVAV
ncbi:restriction endonuclease subunit S [Kordia sp.]|uniref:restriction endonuclease subunit S n=1 Tax=Kordia sp. TaxID=1965332 RepID=UPI003D2657AD